MGQLDALGHPRGAAGINQGEQVILGQLKFARGKGFELVPGQAAIFEQIVITVDIVEPTVGLLPFDQKNRTQFLVSAQHLFMGLEQCRRLDNQKLARGMIENILKFNRWGIATPGHTDRTESDKSHVGNYPAISIIREQHDPAALFHAASSKSAGQDDDIFIELFVADAKLTAGCAIDICGLLSIIVPAVEKHLKQSAVIDITVFVH